MSVSGVRLLFDGVADRIRSVLSRHGSKLWWLHSFYALALGSFVAGFGQKGFEQARWLAASVVGAWLLVVVFFRLFGTGATQQDFHTESTKARIRFIVMTYVLKNLYQSMLFFLIPFYWKSATPGSLNFVFMILLGIFTLLSTLDIVFDHLIMKKKWLASVFHAFALFAALNVLIPAVFPRTRTLISLVTAAAITVLGFWSLHVPPRVFERKMNLVILVGSVALGMGTAYLARAAIPPAPMYLSRGAIGPKQLDDGRLAMEVRTLHWTVIRELSAITDVVIPGGLGDNLQHVWRLDGNVVRRPRLEVLKGPHGSVRLKSQLPADKLPKNLIGPWTIDVETEDGQLVGRVSFTVTD